MSMTESSPFMSPSLIDSVRTTVDAATPSSRSSSPEAVNREAWQHLIDRRLIEWGRDRDRFEDEGIDVPTSNTVQRAIELAQRLRDAGLAAPNSVAHDANGGIVFERRENEVIEVFYVWDDGAIEYQYFHGTRLIERQPL